MLAGSRFHSCGEEIGNLCARAFLPISMTEGYALLECHSRSDGSIKYSGVRPTRQLLVMELSLN